MPTPDILKLEQKMKAFNEELSKDAEVLIKDYFKNLFEAMPQLEKMIWTQYTPSFNDGDPCYFSVNDPYFILNVPVKAYSEVEAGDEVEYIPYDTKDPVLQKLKELTRNFRSEIMMKILETAFGDYSKVTVDKDLNVTREEYYD